MTWQDAISDIDREVSDEDIWDASVSDATIEESMRDFFHVALLTVSQDLPLQRLPDPTTAPLSFGSEGSIQYAQMPEDLFTSRNDMGVVHFILNGDPKHISRGQVPLSTLTTMADNSYVDGELFYVDETIRRIFAINIDDQLTNEVRYVAKPSKPAVGDLGSTDIMFGEEVVKSAVGVVASHLLGVPAGAMDEMKVQQLLSKMYLGSSG